MFETTNYQQTSNFRKFEKVYQILESYSFNKNNLIPILHRVQEEYRYLPEKILTYIATTLDIPPAKVFGVTTFYSHFTLKPKGRFVIKVCAGTACHVKNSNPIVEGIQKKLNLSATKNTTDDMVFTLEKVSCLGACGLAPVVVVNDEVHGEMTPEKMNVLLDGIIKNLENENE
jgi:NADH-quinone oxidoreductase subunit E